ncbi:MAG: patatin-like phospholipase family protein [Clostridia bacterium]
MKKLAIVLGGGSSKGYAHLGFLKVLEKYGIIPDLIVGTSMGALVGGMYASGKSIDDLISLSDKIHSLGHFDIFSTLFKDNILNINKIQNLIVDELSDLTFDDCRIPFVAVATELYTGEEKHFSSGLLSDGIIASISIPGIFPRRQVDNRYYCDGGLLNNLPEDVARKILPDALVVSLDVVGEYPKQIEHIKMKSIEVLVNAISLMTTQIVNLKPQRSDLRIVLTMPNVSLIDFSRDTVQNAIRHGEEETEKYIDEIIKLLKGNTDENFRRTKRKSKKD